MILFENQDINWGIIHSRYGTGAETWKNTGIMVHTGVTQVESPVM